MKKYLMFIMRLFYPQNRVARRLLGALPDFYEVNLEKIKSHGNFTAGDMVKELRKISTWHSNFPGLIEPWVDNTEFTRIFGQASQVDGIHVTRCFMLYQLLKQIDKLGGDIAEVGVRKGRSAKVIALTAENSGRQVYLFDTFEGMPEVDPEKDNFYRKGAFSDTSVAAVAEFMSDCPHVTIYPGFFPDTAAPVKDKTFAFVHIDVDIYRSVRDCCEFYYPRMVSRGIMVFDDPGFTDCAGAKLALDEFFADKEEFPVYLATGQVAVIKK